jgi:hypothetical protein
MLSSITKKGEIESTSAPCESTSAPQVVLVINVNISLVGLIFSSSILQIVQKWCGLDKRTWNPFNMLRTKIGTSSRLYISILVIQDHIESIGKANTIKRG